MHGCSIPRFARTCVTLRPPFMGLKGAKARVQSLVLSQKHWFFPVGDDPRASRVGYRTMARAAEGVGPYGVNRECALNLAQPMSERFLTMKYTAAARTSMEPKT